MKGDRYEVLYQLVRILHANDSLGFPRRCKNLLHFLQQTLPLRTLSLSLLDRRRRCFDRQFTAAGGRLLQPARRFSPGSPEAYALQDRQPVSAADSWFFPVFSGRQSFGVLHLQTAFGEPLTEDWRDFFRRVCAEVAQLLQQTARQDRARQHLAQLTLFSELHSALNRSGTVAELVQAGLATILRHTRAAGIVLSCQGDAAGPAVSRWLGGEAAPWRGALLALAKDQAVKAAELRRPLFQRLPQRARAAEAPTAIVCIPLRADRRPLGTLTLFGRAEDNAFFSATGMAVSDFWSAVGLPFAYALERLQAREHLEVLSRENDRKLRETTLLYRISRAIHSTLNLNELMHLILSVAVAPGGGGFERATLFTVNERTETLQGILCVTRETAAFVMPQQGVDWEQPVVTAEAQKAQREAPSCKRVMKQRLPLKSDNPLARCVRLGRAIFEPFPDDDAVAGGELTAALGLGPFACAPLAGRERALAVLIVDNPLSKEPFSADRRRFFEMFANQAGTAMENSMLLHRLESAHQDLRETQARLIHGEKMASLGEMAASIAHELRNPLVPIGGFADRLGRLAPPGSREQQYAEIIIREVRRMEEMLANILVFSKKQMLCFSACRIETIIEEALNLEAEALARGGVEVLREIDGQLPLIHCDEQKLRQVLINLITNARQAMATGGTLTLRAGRGKLRGDDALEIEVEDSGGGIPGEVMRNLFNPFFTTKEKGTGLGLSISHRIIEHHQGEIEVKNRAQGVVFILRLPTHPPSAAQP